MTPQQALYTATVAPAEALAIGDSGRIEAGLRADLVILTGNPLDSLDVLRQPLAVVLKGNVVDREQLGRLRQMLLDMN